ncbi:MAG TPA: hypothetical protein VIO32_07600 [Candidatus Baltobacteraceae bacterium]
MPFSAWTTFYTMIGSSSAALTGLMFVVIGVIMGTSRERRTPRAIGIFTTPAVVHFGAVLLVAAFLLAPWHSLRVPCALIALLGIAGLIYMLRVIRGTHTLTEYRVDLEDWIWYNILPFFAYGAVCAGSLWAQTSHEPALFVLAAGVVLLMFIGIHNAWDIVTYIAVRDAEE